ncbi:MAG TPA: hypothetical protein VJQ25_04845 [Nitrospira sp.]|nr:hypothetical protein [Nitrospira sp.]
MYPDLSHVTNSRLPRLLIAEKNFSAIEPLIHTCGDQRLDVDFDVCASPRSAVGMLLTKSYQLVISGAHLAEMEDFLLLNRIQGLESFVPLVVTADASEKQSACRALTKGAFDLLTRPLVHEEVVRTIRLALWHSRFKALIVSREQALEKYDQHIAAYPDEQKNDEAYHRALSSVQKTVSSVERTFQRIEESMVRLSDFATKLEHERKKRALERLDTLLK